MPCSSVTLLLGDCGAHLYWQTSGQTCCGSQCPSFTFGAPTICVSRCWGGVWCFPRGAWGNVEEPVCLLCQPPDVFSAVESIEQGFLWVQDHHSQPVSAFTHLSHVPWQWLCDWEARCSRKIVKIMCHCEISHPQSHELWKQVLPWATGLSSSVSFCYKYLKLWLSFVSNTGGIGWKARKLLRRHSVRLYETIHLGLFSWRARYCIVSPFYLLCFWCLQVCLGNFSSLPYGIKLAFL